MASLLDQLGGREGLTVVVAGLVARLAAAPPAGATRGRYEAILVEQLAARLAGGDTLEPIAADVGAGVIAECLRATLTAAGVGNALSAAVLQCVLGHRGD
jgi:hypothetical protein